MFLFIPLAIQITSIINHCTHEIYSQMPLFLLLRYSMLLVQLHHLPSTRPLLLHGSLRSLLSDSHHQNFEVHQCSHLLTQDHETIPYIEIYT